MCPRRKQLLRLSNQDLFLISAICNFWLSLQFTNLIQRCYLFLAVGIINFPWPRNYLAHLQKEGRGKSLYYFCSVCKQVYGYSSRFLGLFVCLLFHSKVGQMALVISCSVSSGYKMLGLATLQSVCSLNFPSSSNVSACPLLSLGFFHL